MSKTDAIQCGEGPAAALDRGHSGVAERQRDVLQRGGAGEHGRRLKDETDFRASYCGTSILVERADVSSPQPVHTRIRTVEETEETHEGGFAGAGTADEGNEFTLFDQQRDTAHGVDAAIAREMALA